MLESKLGISHGLLVSNCSSVLLFTGEDDIFRVCDFFSRIMWEKKTGIFHNFSHFFSSVFSFPGEYGIFRAYDFPLGHKKLFGYTGFYGKNLFKNS